MDPQRTARERARERATRAEETAEVDGDSYPVRAEELAAEYGSHGLDVDVATALESINEGEFDSPTEVREAVEGAVGARERPVPTFDERGES